MIADSKNVLAPDYEKVLAGLAFRGGLLRVHPAELLRRPASSIARGIEANTAVKGGQGGKGRGIPKGSLGP